MLKALVYIALIVLGIAVSLMEHWVPALPPPLSGLHEWEAQTLVGALAGGLLALLLTNLVSLVNRQLSKEGGARQLLQSVLASFVGALCGFVLAWALGVLFAQSPLIRALQGALVLSLTVVGFIVGQRQENLLGEIFGIRPPAPPPGSGPKLIDTSAIIDGRIGDLVKTGFIEGKIVIAEFVLSELHAIADSSDNLRRRKGRRGLDILAELRRSNEIEIETISKDYPGVTDVDRKLIQLAKELNAKIITTDYNLNKVAKVEGVPVLNINELANAVKPRFIPGEEIEVEVIDKGEEIGQGIGYLDDGTMVVVENGRRFIGKKIRTIVNSSLQTEAGKMLFVRPKIEPQKWDQ
uniref:PilT domain protein n=2 Tax=Candidatus Bipolaricaulota TaxID=67810 RepID=H5S8K9_9BACT|nr:PilT domain protein [uncultured Acetothermia bacterium]BAL52614.1 PilT domain protein [uncultured Acetothermia bacterium]BAL59627.1 PilT domain protein [Candidatus Acetothermum autotrophicum]